MEEKNPAKYNSTFGIFTAIFSQLMRKAKEDTPRRNPPK
jgi:hypothetical protein